MQATNKGKLEWFPGSAQAETLVSRLQQENARLQGEIGRLQAEVTALRGAPSRPEKAGRKAIR